MEAALVTALNTLFGGRVWSDVADDITMPFITYQQIGGVPLNTFCLGKTAQINSVIQFTVWAETRNAANTLMRSAEAILMAEPFRGRPEGELTARFDEKTRARGALQDFSFWY